MEFTRMSVHFFLFSSLIGTLLTISFTSAFRLNDVIDGRLKHIPLKRTRPDGRFGFLRGNDFEQFDKELRQLFIDDGAEDHIRLRRSVDGTVRSHNRTIIDEFELKGDNHSVAFLHWAGKKSSVIYIYTCGQINQTENDHTLCEDAYFWRSSDYGSTFHRVDEAFSHETINNVDFCASNNKKVIVSSLKDGTLYISTDEGKTFKSTTLAISPHVISCSPYSDQWIIAHDTNKKKVFYASDGGKRFFELSENVLRHSWAPGNSSELFLEVSSGEPYTSLLKHIKFPPCSQTEAKKCVKIFDTTLGPFSSHSFEVVGKYMFVEKGSSSKALYVWYKNYNSNQAQNFFQRARFPLTDYEEKEYKVVDGSENELMVVVKHKKDYYNLYISDVTGAKFSLSLENILSTTRTIWGKKTLLVDLRRVKSLPGTYVANVLDKIGNKVRSVITFNKGGEWHQLKAPEFDHRGRPTNCYLPRCSLHIHIQLSRWLYYIPGVLSSDSAVGIIVAQGNLGNRLGQHWPIGVFMSNDGGLTWTKEFSSFYDFVIGDHGGIIAAVGMWRNQQEVWYTCTEGKSWKNISLDNQVVIYGMVTEPGETTLIVNLFGQYSKQDFQWLSVKLNFTSVLNQKCQAGNYTYWSPNDERADGRCLLGQHLTYERRKSGDCCFNGMEYEREINISSCLCEADDFECDFGFEHPSIDEVCVATSSANPIPNPCPEGKTYLHSRGYRKVAGDRCVGGVENTFKPEPRLCPISAPGDMSIVFKAKSDAVEVNKQVFFNLSQKQGSKESTQYTWNFGDKGPNSELNLTGINLAKRVSYTFKKHGHFVVTLRATNSAGHFDVSTEVTVLDPITSLEIDPPHAVVIGKEVWFNVTLSSANEAPRYGYVYFMWAFEQKILPLLTWKSEVSHTFMNTGKYEITVTAHSFIGTKDGKATVTVYDKLTTVRLSFDTLLDSVKQQTKEWRKWFKDQLEELLDRLLDVKTSRLEVWVSTGISTYADVSITPATEDDPKTRKELVDLLRQKVSEGAAEILIPKDVTIRVTRVDVLPDKELSGDPFPTDQHGSDGTRLAIGIGVGATMLVIFLVVILAYFLRRYHRLQSRYTHLRLYSDGGELRDRDPLIEDDEQADDEPALHHQPGGTLRYIALPTNTDPDPESDDELIDNFQPGTLAVLPPGQNGVVQDGNPIA
ncbi:unnamed protein product [Porites evermanni]|uniref:PKD domain-containing protein n=1 Tax=Porites evermanni TaxID=104178 RepID=A0ABN8LGE6_9CNID|nr:unnamed protein product [Porites evermanni]